MGLSGEPFQVHVDDYKELVKLTKEGVFVNIVKYRCAENSEAKSKDEKGDADRLADDFFGVMDVYPTKESVVIREHFDM